MDEAINLPEVHAKLLKPAKVAEILNVSPEFVYRLMREGEIRTVIMRGAKRVRPEDLVHYIESCLFPPLQQ